MFSSFLKVSSFYAEYLKSYYSRNLLIQESSFEEQYKHIMAEGYGYADYFPGYFKKNHSIRAAEIVHNATHLQQAWARENGSSLSGDDLLLEQIRTFQPEVLMIQASTNFSVGFIERIKDQVKSVRLLIGHCCAPYTASNLEAFSRYDVMLTCSETFLEQLKEKQINCYLVPHAVEATLVSEIPPESPPESLPENDIIFIGSLIYRKEFHRKRIAYVEEILKSGLPLRMYGLIEEDSWSLLKLKQASYLFVKSAEKLGMERILKNPSLKKIAQLNEIPGKSRYSSMIKENLRRELLFGSRMLGEIARHAVGFNLHGELAGDYAANVRIFEVTGAGTLLVTDHKKNIGELYEPDSEILTYNSIEECIEKLTWAIDHPREAGKIALAGQQRTLKDHSVENRVDLLCEIINKELS